MYRYSPRRPIDEGVKPVEAGKEYDVTIEDVSRRGEGIARIQGFIIFVPKARRGDRVRIRIVDVRPRFATAQVVG